MSVSEILDNWTDGDASTARRLDVPVETVAAWRRRQSIPVAYWRRLVAAAQERGRADATFETLVDACTQTSAPMSGEHVGSTVAPQPLGSTRRNAAPASTLSDAAAQALAQNLSASATRRRGKPGP